MNELKLYKGQCSVRAQNGFSFPPFGVQVIARSEYEAREKLKECNPGTFISLKPNQHREEI